MLVQPTLRRSAVVLAAATVAVLAVLAPATSAYAADTAVQVNIGGLNSTQNAGAGRPDNFTVSFKTQDRQQVIQNLHSVLVVHLDGLPPEAVHIAGRFGELNRSTQGANVVFTDPEAVTFLPGRTTTTRNYQILFDGYAPTGHGQLGAFAIAGDGSQNGSDNAGFTVKLASGAQPTPTHGPSPSASPAPTVPVPIQTGPQVSLAPLDQGGRATPLASESGGVPVFIYIMGGILVAMGAAILFLLFRNPRDAAPAPDGPIDYPPRADPTWAPGPASQGYPPIGPRMGAPTAQMPVVRDHRSATMPQSRSMMERPTAHHPRVPNGPRTGPSPAPPAPPTPPGVDPWANTDDTLAGGSGPLPRR